MAPLDESGQETAAPVPAPNNETPAGEPRANSLDAYLDAELRALEEQGVRIDEDDTAPAPVEQPATPAAPDPAAPGQTEQQQMDPATAAHQHALQLAATLRQKDLEIARLQGAEQERQRQARTAAAPPAPKPPPQVTPEQAYAALEQHKQAIDKKFDEGELDPVAWRQQRDQIVMRQATVIARAEAHGAVRPVAQRLQEIPPPPAPQSDMWLRERTAELMAADPWLARVPAPVLNAFKDEALELAKNNGLDASANTSEGLFNYRRCIRAVAKAHGMDRAYGEPGGSPGATTRTPATPTRAPVPGAAPIPAPALKQPPSLATHPGSQAGPIGGIEPDRLLRMGFFEALEGVSDADMEAIAPSR